MIKTMLEVITQKAAEKRKDLNLLGSSEVSVFSIGDKCEFYELFEKVTENIRAIHATKYSTADVAAIEGNLIIASETTKKVNVHYYELRK